MEPSFDEIKAAAERIRRLHYPNCWQSERDIDNCVTIADLRRIVVKYRQEVCSPVCVDSIVRNYSEMLDAVGLRVQRYVDGRVRLYLA